jgi:hypothetical protein
LVFGHLPRIAISPNSGGLSTANILNCLILYIRRWELICFILGAKNRKKTRKKAFFFKTAEKAEGKGLKQGCAAGTPAIPRLDKYEAVPICGRVLEQPQLFIVHWI